MKMIYETKLDEEILDVIENVSKMEVGSEEHKRACESLSKLLEESRKMKEVSMQKNIQERKASDDYEVKFMEIESKLKELEKEKTRIFIENGVKLFAIGTGLCFSIYTLRTSLRFETTDNPTFTPMKEIIKKGLSYYKLI